MIKLFIIILSLVSSKEFYKSHINFLDTLLDDHLISIAFGDPSTYREALAQKVFDSLVSEYPDRLFFVNVYAPVMGFDNHASRAYHHLYSRLHNQNEMRFNIVVSSVALREYTRADEPYLESKLDQAKSQCVISDCANALRLKDHIQGLHGCLEGIHVVSREADSHVRQNFEDTSLAYAVYRPFSDRYDLYAWSSGKACLDSPLT